MEAEHFDLNSAKAMNGSSDDNGDTTNIESGDNVHLGQKIGEVALDVLFVHRS